MHPLHAAPDWFPGLAGNTATVGIAAGIMLAGNPAQGAVVPNFFVRSCTFTDTNCSPYAQTNPPYNSGVPSQCQTKGYLGAGGGTYQVPAGQRCPNNSHV